MSDFPVTHFKDILMFVALIIIADTAQISLPAGRRVDLRVEPD